MARFEKRARLTRPPQFKAVFSQGRRVHARHLTAVVVANTQGHPRLGLAISRKASSLAVGRNRIKRQVREAFRARQASLPAVDIVIMARPGAAQAPTKALRDDLDTIWNGIGKRWPGC